MIIYTYILYFVICICILYFYLGVAIAILTLNMMRNMYFHLVYSIFVFSCAQLWDDVVIFGMIYFVFCMVNLIFGMMYFVFGMAMVQLVHYAPYCP